MTKSSWKAIAVVALAALCALLILLFLRGRMGRTFSPDSVVVQVEKLSQLVTVRYRIQRVVGLKEAKEPLGEESLLLMVEGEVLAGVDLHRVRPKDVTSTGSTYRIAIPPAAMVDAFLDEKKTQVWDHRITWWTPWVPYSPGLEHKARLQAVEDIRKAALDMGILDQAQTNAQNVIRDFFEAAGLHVQVVSRGLD